MDKKLNEIQIKKETDSDIVDHNDLNNAHTQVYIKKENVDQEYKLNSQNFEVQGSEVTFHFLDINSLKDGVKQRKSTRSCIEPSKLKINLKTNINKVSAELEDKNHLEKQTKTSKVVKLNTDEQQSSSKLKGTQRAKKEHSCEVCSKKFKRNYDLQQHMVVHSDDKPYTCYVCEKSFSRKRNLDHHMIIHTDKKSFECEICNRGFRYKHVLEKHKLIHTGCKPYMCDLCAKLFRSKFELTLHTRIHTGEKPYECTFCTKTFSSNANLHTHRRSHTGEPSVRYTCEICDKSFSKRSRLTKHKLTHDD